MKNPRTKKNLEIDGYCEKYKIGFEHNGKQHYEFPNIYHKNEGEFKYQLQRDIFKRRMCKNMGVELITIPYNVPESQLEIYIVEKLRAIGIRLSE